MLSTRIFSDSPLTVFVASATVALPLAPLDPLGAAVGASVGGEVGELLAGFELLEHAASETAASAAAIGELPSD